MAPDQRDAYNLGPAMRRGARREARGDGDGDENEDADGDYVRTSTRP